MAVKHGPCLLTLKKGSRLSKPSARGNFSASPTWSARRATVCKARLTSLWAPQEPLLASHMPQQPFQSQPSRHFGGWVTPWSAEKTLDGQHQRMDIPAHATDGHPCPCQNCSQGPTAEKKKNWKKIFAESSFIAPPSPHPPAQSLKGLK